MCTNVYFEGAYLATLEQKSVKTYYFAPSRLRLEDTDLYRAKYAEFLYCFLKRYQAPESKGDVDVGSWWNI